MSVVVLMILASSSISYNTSAAGAIYYINRSHAFCSDSGPGNQKQPWCTINQALKTLTAGDTAYVLPGVYDVSAGPHTVVASRRDTSLGMVRTANAGTASAPIRLIALSTAKDIIGKGNAPEAQDDRRQAFITNGLLLIEKDHWQVEGFYVRNRGGIRPINNTGFVLRDTLVFVAPSAEMPAGGGSGLMGNNLRDALFDHIEAWSVRCRCCNPDAASTVLTISDSSNFVVRNSYLYGGRNVHTVVNSRDFVFQNNQILLGQEHLGGPGDGTSNWTYVNNIMGLGGQEAPFVKANCSGTISNGTIHNNIVLDTSGPHLETFCPSNLKWNGISNITIRNNLIIRTVPTVCLRSWAANVNSVDSDYNFCIFQDTTSRRVFWSITGTSIYNLTQWQTQTDFPQIRQDPNSKFLLNIDPGFNTPLDQLLEVDGLDECSKYFTTPGGSCMSNCRPPYRIRLKANFSLKDDSMLIAAGDPSYVKSPTGRRANVGLLQEPASVIAPQRFRIVQ